MKINLLSKLDIKKIVDTSLNEIFQQINLLKERVKFLEIQLNDKINILK